MDAEEPPWPSDEQAPRVVRPQRPAAAPATPPATISAPAAPPAAREPAAPVRGPRRYGVGELVREAQRLVESRFPSVWVEGELSNVQRPQSGHLYFTLKDAQGQVAAVMFRVPARGLRFAPRDGLQVLCRGGLSIYDGQGKFQLYVEEMRLSGAGAEQARLEELKRKLAAEGLFDARRKRPLPFLPRRIGVVTSPTGAALRDLVRVVHRRFPARILLAPASVQGAEAVAELRRSLQALQRVPDVDVIVLCRGGGSAEDLSAFNDEELARAIAACRVPVISAVGHEVDVTIADHVADLRVPTPSAAGERVVPVAADLRAEVARLGERLARSARRSLREKRLTLDAWTRRMGDPRRQLDRLRQRIDDQLGRAERALRRRLERWRQAGRTAERELLEHHPRTRLLRLRAELDALDAAQRGAARHRLTVERGRFGALVERLQALSPLGWLARGYAVARVAGGGPLVRTPGQAPPGTAVDVLLSEGGLRCQVERPLHDDELLPALPPG
jgi:exodeoxyribonuclease VII large subunit